MDQKQAQVFGCFLGVLVALVLYLIVDTFVNVALWVEYTLFAIGCLCFGFVGVLISRGFSKDNKLPSENKNKKDNTL